MDIVNNPVSSSAPVLSTFPVSNVVNVPIPTSSLTPELISWIKSIAALQAGFTISVDANGDPYCVDKSTYLSSVSRWWNKQDRTKTVSLIVEKLDSVLSLLDENFDFECYMLVTAAVGSFKTLALTYNGDKNDLHNKILNHQERFLTTLDKIGAKESNAVLIADGFARAQQVSMFEPEGQPFRPPPGGDSVPGSSLGASPTSSPGRYIRETVTVVSDHSGSGDVDLQRNVPRTGTEVGSSSGVPGGLEYSVQPSPLVKQEEPAPHDNFSRNSSPTPAGASQEVSAAPPAVPPSLNGTVLGDPNKPLFTYSEKPKRKRKTKNSTATTPSQSTATPDASHTTQATSPTLIFGGLGGIFRS